jgi:hypothetical protein
MKPWLKWTAFLTFWLLTLVLFGIGEDIMGLPVAVLLALLVIPVWWWLADLPPPFHPHG